jgi:hypothetical protein
MSELPDLAAWSPCVGDAFRLQLDEGQSVDLELIEATALEPARGAPRQDPFSLVFRGPANVQLAQTTYRLQHEGMGEVPVFLVPIGADEEGTFYEAIFN